MAGRLGFLLQGRGTSKLCYHCNIEEDIKIRRSWIFRFFQSHHLKHSYLSSVNITRTNFIIDFVMSAGSQRVIKRRHLELTINAELCMKYQMSVFKTIEKHLGRMNDCLCACTVKPMSATMKIEFFMSKIPWSFSWKQSASFYHMS